MVCVGGMSSGAGLVPAEGDDEGELVAGTWFPDIVELVAEDELSAPGGLDPFPVRTVVAPSGPETLIAGVPFSAPWWSEPFGTWFESPDVPRGCIPLELEFGSASAVSGAVESTRASFSLSFPFFFDFFEADCCWPMGRA